LTKPVTGIIFIIVLKLLQVYIMTIPKGGRGVKAPYETTVIRVPKPIEAQTLQQIQDFREGKKRVLEEHPSKQDMIALANSLMSAKKSKKLALEKLLQVFYKDNEIKL
jgi:hypothetical protein